MAKQDKNSGIQPAAGLIRYFDEESEDAIQIPELYAVDVCSGVEQEKGKKSKMLMYDFIERVRRIN